MNDSPLLELRNVSKSFGSVQALTDVDFEARAGEVMALVGDNGAGKSTLIKCIAGIHPMDSGTMLFDGEEVSVHSPKDAAKLGIEVVYQDLALCDNLDVVQNMYLGRETHDWFQRLKEPPMEARAVQTLAGLRVTTIKSIRQAVATLSGGQRQSVAVARAVMWNSRLVILDEPTAALGVAQTEQVLELVKRLAEQGLGVVLISHNLHDIFEVADRITVLRLGRHVGIYERASTTQQAGRARDHRRPADEGRRDRVGRGGHVTASAPESAAPAAAPLEPEGSLSQRLWDNVKGGNLGSWPVGIALAIIVVVFSQTAQNFFTPGNFTNIITQMAGTCLLAYGVVFVLLIGEIDLSIAFVSGVAGVVVAKAQLPTGWDLPWYLCVFLAILAAVAIGAFQGSIVALIGVPSFVVTLAGYEIWQGVIQSSVPGVIVIQDNAINNFSNYFFSDQWGWILAVGVSLLYVGTTLGGALSGRRHGIAIRRPIMLTVKLVAVPAIALTTAYILNKDRGVPLALLWVVGGLVVWTFVAKRTTFGRHVYAVGGNAEAARRAGINVARIRIFVFMISRRDGRARRHRPRRPPEQRRSQRRRRDAADRRDRRRGHRRDEPVRRPRRDPRRADRRRDDLDGLERDVHPRLLDRHDLHRHRRHPPRRRHVRHDRPAPPAGVGALTTP